MEESNKNNDKVFSSGEVMSLLENINDGIKVVAEGQLDLSRRLDGVDGKIDRIETKLEKIESDVVDIKMELSNKADKKTTDDHEKRIVSLEKMVPAKA